MSFQVMFPLFLGHGLEYFAAARASASLLEERDRRYYTTEKGESFLELMAKIREIVDLDV